MKSVLIAFSAAFLVAAAPPTGPRVVQRIPLRDGGWDILTVDPQTHRVFVPRSDGVDAINTLAGTVSSQLVSGERFHGVTIVPGSDLAVATEAAGSAIVFNRITGAVTAEVKTDPDADATIYEPSTQTVWVMNGDSGTISIVDPFGGKVVDKISLGSSLEFAAIDGKGHLFVNLSDRGEIAEIDIARRTIMRSAMLDGCQHPTGLAYVSPGILISACANGLARLTRASDLRPEGEIPIGPHPDGAFADEARHRAYIPSGGDGTLAVIDTSGALPTKIATVQTEVGARTGTVDASTGAVYTVAAKFGPPPASGGRPAILPGTVELLVVR
jgi:DNA-binding beta-propeller fold protein YncE